MMMLEIKQSRNSCLPGSRRDDDRSNYVGVFVVALLFSLWFSGFRPIDEFILGYANESNAYTYYAFYLIALLVPLTKAGFVFDELLKDRLNLFICAAAAVSAFVVFSTQQRDIFWV